MNKDNNVNKYNKCLAKDINILMYDCSVKPIQDIKINDLIMGDDSTPRKVLDIIEGEEEMYEIIPARGQKYCVSKDHILTLKAPKMELIYKEKDRYCVKWLEKCTLKCKTFGIKNNSSDEIYEEAKNFLENECPKKEGYVKYGDIKEFNTYDYYNLSQKSRVAYTKYTVGIEFNKRKIDIDPYILGYWLGDGHSDSTRITTADPEIVEYFTKFANDNNLLVKKYQNYGYDFTTGNVGGYYRNPFRNFLNKYNLFGNKHIPNDYKFNSKEVRLQVLAGIIDSDGYNANNNGYDFCFKSEKLTNDIIFLARSLGYFILDKKIVQKTCTNSSNGRVTNNYYRFHICGNTLNEIPCLLKRKKVTGLKGIKDVNMSSIKIKSIGKLICYNFKLDGNGRFLLENFTIV
ncbi:homing endonuclease [Klosneuvirus KNV1]|uniref:Homing endonuclease n=1 Tax=Klosneuvirus KNV1 TaxID=1977640 RepID=A0A1V0SK08_9VIRU|nr:homing endonuclease [Klosneuvirus KNV1]